MALAALQATRERARGTFIHDNDGIMRARPAGLTARHEAQAPAAARNREPIAEVLASELPEGGLVLEIASGTGEHVVHFARRFAQLDWQPSDPDADALASIAAWRAHEGLANILTPVLLDASAADWPISTADAIMCINMVHISPVEATLGLLGHAADLLPQGAPLVFYGPYIEDEVVTAREQPGVRRQPQVAQSRMGSAPVGLAR